MNSSKLDRAAPRHNLSDWLILHGLDSVTCCFIIDRIDDDITRMTDTSPDSDCTSKNVGVDTAWFGVRDALRAYMPDHQDIIDDAFKNTKRLVVDQSGGSRKAMTIDNGSAAYPTIVYSYRGDPADYLIIAHEFGHAVQLRASQGRFVPPVMREVCAFIGEAALLSYVKDKDRQLYIILKQCWLKDNEVYLGRHRDRLETSLSRPAAVYRYSWNYPIARFLAGLIAPHAPSELVWGAFEGRLSVKDVLREVGGPGPWS